MTADLEAARAVTRRMLDDWIPDVEHRGWWHVGSGMAGPGEPMTDAEHRWLLDVEAGVGLCAGSRRPWGSGTGSPMCPACHAGPGALGVAAPRRHVGWWSGVVPDHLDRRRSTPSTSSHPAPGEDDPTAARPHTLEDR